jgi:hypothetical protein
MMNIPVNMPRSMPGSRAEFELQERYCTRARAEAFYSKQILCYLNPQMRSFIARQEMFFLATADLHGECDVSFRAGEAGFVHVLGERLLGYPEYRGNGVMASLANITENPHAGLNLSPGWRKPRQRCATGVPTTCAPRGATIFRPSLRPEARRRLRARHTQPLCAINFPIWTGRSARAAIKGPVQYRMIDVRDPSTTAPRRK